MRTLSWLAAFSALRYLHAGEPEGPLTVLRVICLFIGRTSATGHQCHRAGPDGSVLREGSNGWTCMVGNPGLRPRAAGPHRTTQCLFALMRWMRMSDFMRVHPR